MKIVTAADQSHGLSLLQLLASLKPFFSRKQIIVYDLGLNESQAGEVRALGHELRTFQFDKYPAFFDISKASGEYAWKAVIVREVAEQFPGTVLWLDAGNVVLGRLPYIRFKLATAGFYCGRSHGVVEQWTHPGTLERLKLPAEFWGKRNFATGAIGFNTRFPRARLLLDRWAQCSMDRDIIAPEGSSRANHRQDQALLTVLAYLQGYRPNKRAKWRGLLFHQDVDGHRLRKT